MSKKVFKSPLSLVILLAQIFLFSAEAGAREPRDYVIRARDLKTQQERYIIYSSLRPLAGQPGRWELQSRAQGPFHTYDNVSWECKVQLLDEGGLLLPVLAQWNIYQQGKLVENWGHRYDLSGRGIIFSRSIPRKRMAREFAFPIKGPTTDYTSLALFLEDFVPVVNPGQQQKFLLLTSEPRLFRVQMKYLQEETLALPKGPRKAVKYRLVVDMGILDEAFDRWIPPTFVWYDALPPHRWLKYQGLETGQGSTVIDAELIGETLP